METPHTFSFNCFFNSNWDKIILGFLKEKLSFHYRQTTILSFGVGNWIIVNKPGNWTNATNNHIRIILENYQTRMIITHARFVSDHVKPINKTHYLILQPNTKGSLYVNRDAINMLHYSWNLQLLTNGLHSNIVKIIKTPTHYTIIM